MVELLVKRLEVQVVSYEDGALSDWYRVLAIDEKGRFLIHRPDGKPDDLHYSSEPKLQWVSGGKIGDVRYMPLEEGQEIRAPRDAGVA